MPPRHLTPDPDNVILLISMNPMGSATWLWIGFSVFILLSSPTSTP
jgi:hypothetical protein